jgi:hypothetical protein
MRGSFVQQIEPAKDIMRMEEVDKFFSVAFAHVCALRVVDEVVVDGLTVGWRRLERWPCWGRGRAVRLGLTWLRIAVSVGLFLRLLFWILCPGEQLEMATRIFSGRLRFCC